MEDTHNLTLPQAWEAINVKTLNIYIGVCCGTQIKCLKNLLFIYQEIGGISNRKKSS